MKYIQSLITLLIVIFCSGTLVTSCMESSKKVTDVTHTMKSAKEKFNTEYNAAKTETHTSEKIVSISANKKQKGLRSFTYSL
ncbi:hypothetical protein [Cytophaga hutchinsonii]|uniref:Lipoprotein n=1 Tax=Cytophaga hutchinsonii (strain ATCC 33406 / DSM 1761 / CIP 103989 / NBRC 15051 / NCIMB 9469 / D465) TaxID=269798 RepID=A0A6N4SWL0_CYTH3|nr:hypothetical protein [Cytophaga hutchinsonii]ABG60789.1 hypothetical protein CHU_3556 [Cytophaga hutchinsonii ATCC 33406]SFX71979.1 hypothetical protein SAMN04487930_108114 [Cytophaga hutchinsonii ATCC 33406]